jgi:hypothetical protein
MNASFQQAEPPSESVTSTRDRNRERKRLQRERQRPVDAIVYETEDWQLFLSEDTLPQKAGCYPEQLAGLVLRELVPRVAHIAGYNLFSFTRASAVVKCQSALTCFLFRLSSQAATSSTRVSLLEIRRSRH